MPAPKRTYPSVPLSADPDFRLAQRSWERFSTERPRGQTTPQIELDLDNTDIEVRSAAERKVAAYMADLLITAAAWALRNPNADVEQEIGSGMLPAINWIVRVFQVPTSVEALAPMARSKEVEVKKRGEERPGSKGRVLSEGVPPCWSPRWSEQRNLLRTVSAARLVAGEFYTFFMSLIPRIQDMMSTYTADGELRPNLGARVAKRILVGSPALAREPLDEARRELQMAQLEAKRLQSDPNARIRYNQARNRVRQLEAALSAQAASIEEGLSMSIPAFMERQYKRFAAVEEVSRTELTQIRNRAAGLSRQRNKAWQALNQMYKPRPPREQTAALEGLLEGEEGEDSAIEPPEIDFDEII